MKKLVLLFVLFFFTSIFGQNNISAGEKAICEERLEFSVKKELGNSSLNDIIITIAQEFIGVEYEAGTLDQNESEELVVHLSGLDCYTLVDNSLALARSVKFGDASFENYLKELENIRYRDGKLDGYISRLHYVTDWIYDLGNRGILLDVTEKIGGEKYSKTINFMSENSDKYVHLKDNSENISRIKSVEEIINSRANYYVPQDRIAEVESKIESGDIIALTTSIKGLDIVHVGYAMRQDDGKIHFLHAPNVGYKVQITKKPLSEYVKGNKSQTGIMVFRAAE
ncbi:MAG: xylanase [Melioribacteraceae bacterium]|nr:MAG: xylanase [Melioribacteraceae bacterium]